MVCPISRFPVCLLGSGGLLGLRRNRTPGGIDQIYYKSVESRSHTSGGEAPSPSYQEANHDSKPQT